MHELQTFFLSTSISFVGTIPLAVINLMVIRMSLYGRYRDAKRFSIGAALPEFGYAMIAFQLFYWIESNQEFMVWFDYLLVVFLTVIGVSMYVAKTDVHQEIEIPSHVSFFKGLGLSIVNPQLLPYWFSVIVLMRNQLNTNELSEQVFFSLGATVGGGAMLLLYAYLAYTFKDKILIWLNRFNIQKIIGLGILLMAFIKLISVLPSFI